MLVLPNMMIELSNVRKKSNKSTLKCDVGTA